MENRISASLPADQLKTVLELIKQLEAALPFLMALSPEERKSLPRMGDASRPFVDKSLKLAQAHNDFLPRSFDTGEFAADVQLYNALDTVRTRLSPLVEKLDDTMTVTGSDAYLAALEVYRYASTNGEAAGLDELIALMGKRFSHRSRKPKTDTQA